MTDKEFNKFDKHYNKLVKKGTIKTMNDAYIYKLAIEKAIEVIRCCDKLPDLEKVVVDKITEKHKKRIEADLNSYLKGNGLNDTPQGLIIRSEVE